MSRRFPDRPVLGVGAVIVDGSRVLLVKRAQEPLKGEWSLPGGAVELGETLEAAVVREVGEETGLKIEVGPVVEVFERVQRERSGRVEYHYVVVDYLCRAVGGTLAPASDVADAIWADGANLESYRLTENATNVIARGLRLSGSHRW